MRYILSECLKAAILVGAFFGTVQMLPADSAAPAYVWEVIGWDGEVYIAGSGDTCHAAWEGVVLPSGWQSIRCIEASN